MKKITKKMPKLVAIIMALALIAPIALRPIEADAARGRWISSYGEWYYQLPSGNLATGWQFIDGNWYFFATSSTSSASKYEMVTGMWRIDYQWYYFNASGAMATGWVYWDYDWYYFMPGSGTVAQGWKYISGNWYYFEQGSAYDMSVDGNMLTGWWKINGQSYYFENSGAMFTGWRMINGNWYYFQPGSGASAKGWQAIGNTWYYFDTDGIMATGWENINNTWYYFDLSSGAMTTGWKYVTYEEGGAWHYFDASGAEAYGWRKIGGNWYYFEGNESGEMVTGFREIDGATYYFDTNGAMKTGWVYNDGSYYYFLSGGQMAKGQWVGNYYMNIDGTMAKNQWIGNYYVGSNGLWIPGYQGPGPSYEDGWNYIGGQWYYYYNGQRVTGLMSIGEHKYYFNASGVRQSGWVQLNDGLYYYFSDSDGHMLTNQWIGDYYVGEDGAWIPGYKGQNASLQTLKQYIINNGFTNSDGNKVINYTETSSNGTEYIGAILYNYETDSFEFVMASDGSSATSVMIMPVDGTSINGQNLYPEFAVYFSSNDTYFEALATINASTYTEDSTVYFTITDTNNFTNSQIQEMGNTFLQLGFSCWEILLNRAGISLYDIGFTAF